MVERLLGERVDRLVVCGKDRAFEFGELLESDDSNRRVSLDAVLIKALGRRVHLGDAVDSGVRGRRRELSVVENCVSRPLVLPTLEDVPNRIGRLLPVEISRLYYLEERESVLGLFSTSSSEAPWCDRERPEVGLVETAVQGACHRRIRHKHKVKILAFLVERIDRLCSCNWHGLSDSGGFQKCVVEIAQSEIYDDFDRQSK